MERYNKILQNEEYKRLLKRLAELESDRKFCRHGLTHLTGVCRIAYIMALENNLKITKDVIYAAGLLHDIGRVAEYEKNVSHDEESARIARGVLGKCDYTEEEITLICQAIHGHRGSAENVHTNKYSYDGKTELDNLAYILKRADKLSRNCFDCDVYEECKWQESMKNKGIF